MLEWRTLLSEDRKTLSLGRIAFWIALGYSTWFWFHPFGATFPPALLEFLYATLAYNLGAKGIGAYQRVKTSGFASMASGFLGGNQTQTPTTPINTPVKPVPISSQDDDITDEDLEQTRKP